MKKDKPHNNNSWTEARFKSFVMGALRQASNRWPPKYTARKEARVRRGVYLCEGYNREPHEVRAKEIMIDHKEPVVPISGFSSWDDIISRMFCESDNLQALCKDCHKEKTQEERKARKCLK